MTTATEKKPGFDQVALMGLINQVKEDPDVGKTVWKASTKWNGGFRSEARIRDFTIAMDEPKPLGGSDTAPNMVEIVLGAYGCCLTTGYAANAAMRGIELEDIQIDLEGDLDLNAFFGLQSPDECCPGYTTVRAKVSLKAPNATPEQIAELHAAVKATSPVGAILERPIEVTTELQN
jgi:uncharacterized OsmC-like protein